MKFMSLGTALFLTTCARTASPDNSLVSNGAVSDHNVISHQRLADRFHPFGRCIYLGKSLPMDQAIARKILGTHAPVCASHAKIINIAAPDKIDETPVASDEWPGGDISLTRKGEPCLIHADLREESGALMFATDSEIGMVCVSVEFIHKDVIWHSDLVFMLAR